MPFSLNEVKFEITPSCNQRCAFCFNHNSFAANGSRSSKSLSTTKAIAVIDNAAESGAKTIRFTGGEPMMRKDLAALLKRAQGSGLRVRLNTNGTLFGRKELGEVAKYADEVFFPLHSLGQAEETAKTGLQGGFAKKMAAMNALRGNCKIYAGTIATRENIERLERFEALSQLLCDEWFLLRPIPTAESKGMVKSDLALLADKLENLGPSPCKLYHAVPFCAIEGNRVEKFSEGAASCGPLNLLVVRPDGTIAPCYSMAETLGSALKEDIGEVWKTHPFAIAARNFEMLPKKCKTCRHKAKCMSGCRAAAKICGGSYFAKDPLMA